MTGDMNLHFVASAESCLKNHNTNRTVFQTREREKEKMNENRRADFFQKENQHIICASMVKFYNFTLFWLSFLISFTQESIEKFAKIR